MTRRRLLGLGLAALSLLIVIAYGTLDRNSRPNDGASASGSSLATAHPDGEHGHQENESPAAGGGTGGRNPAGSGSNGQPTAALPANWAFGSYDANGADDPTPAGCTLKRGSPCPMRFAVRYRVSTLDAATVRLGAFENGSETSVATRDVPVKRGSARLFEALLYTPTGEAETVRFRVQLLNAAGDIVHEGYPLPPVLKVLP